MHGCRALTLVLARQAILLADRTNGSGYATLLRPSDRRRRSVTLCIVA